MFERLISLVRQEQVSLFIGAGFSIEACAPSVYDLKEAILKEIHETHQKNNHKEDSFASLSDFFVKEVCLGSRNQLIRILRKAFEFTPKCMDDHKILAKIPHFKRIFTTNYDTLLEDSYSYNDVQVVRTDADCAYVDKPFTVFKVHGDFTDPDSVVITTDDYTNFFTNNQNPMMWNIVTTEFATKNILFIGYSLEDNNILDIIGKVSSAQKNNQNEMFLIAPNISKEKQDVLRRMKVHYYDAVANTFLTQLVKELEEHISEDFENKCISPETYSRFWNSYKAVPTVVTPVKGKNVIKKIDPISEEPLQHQIQMSVKEETGEKLKNIDFEKDGEIISNKIIPNVPCIRISGDSLLKCQHIVNGVVVTSAIKEVIVSPVEKKIDLTIRIPSRHFLEMITAKVYRLNSNTARFIIDCGVYMMTMELHLLKNASNTLTFNFDFKKSYKNNNEAIKWIEIPCALSSNDDFIIQELSMYPLSLSQQIQPKRNYNFDKIKQYYIDIQQIELELGKKFKIYNACTNESYRIARYVCSYLKHEPLNVLCEYPDGFDFSTDTEEGEELTNTFNINDLIAIVTTEEKELTYKLNNRTFKIPFGHKIFKSCQITNIQKEQNGQTHLEFHYSEPIYQLLLSDKPITEAFPNMKPLNAIIKMN